jgi:hypothetical protein
MNKRWRRLLAIPDLMFEADMDGTFIIIILIVKFTFLPPSSLGKKYFDIFSIGSS